MPSMRTISKSLPLTLLSSLSGPPLSQQSSGAPETNQLLATCRRSYGIYLGLPKDIA